MKIYRYCSPKSVGCLEHDIVLFTPPIYFNDPFDVRPLFSPCADRTYLKQVAKKISPSYGFMNHDLPRAVRREKSRQNQKESVTDFLHNKHRFAELMQNDMPEKVSERIGILCLTAIYDNLLMWAHYADSHKGFVVEFDSEDVNFKALGNLCEVKYDKIRPTIQPGKPLNFDFFKQKSKVWNYEEEFRIIRKLGQCSAINLNGCQFFSAPLPRSCIKTVYLGNRIEQSVTDQILGLMKGTNARFYKTELHPQEFSLIFKPIK